MLPFMTVSVTLSAFSTSSSPSELASIATLPGATSRNRSNLVHGWLCFYFMRKHISQYNKNSVSAVLHTSWILPYRECHLSSSATYRESMSITYRQLKKRTQSVTFFHFDWQWLLQQFCLNKALVGLQWWIIFLYSQIHYKSTQYKFDTKFSSTDKPLGCSVCLDFSPALLALSGNRYKKSSLKYCCPFNLFMHVEQTISACIVKVA